MACTEIDTGIPFFDHMLTLFAAAWTVRPYHDRDEVDYHQQVEDTGMVSGSAQASPAEKRGIRRYGFFLLPMDEPLARVALDLSNRQAFVFVGGFQVPHGA